MNLDDMRAVIESAKARDSGQLETFVRAMAPKATDAEVAEAVALAVEVVETVPVLLAQAAQAAEERHLGLVVMPLLEHAARYFVDPADLIPEMTQGMAGLLDDTYLALRILENLNRGPHALFDADFDEPLRFLRRLVGPDISRQLDSTSLYALQDVSTLVTRVWMEMGRPS